MNSIQESLINENSNSNYLNFMNLPNQVHRKANKKGFQFTLLIVGEAGLGKSTLVNSLFLTNLYKNREIAPISEKDLNKKVQMLEQNAEVEEKGVKLKLTVVDALNFGESINSDDSIQPIINYIDEQFDKFFQYENGLNRRNIVDTRVHCCFYFVSPIGYGLKKLDIQFLKQLSTKCNVIPIIAKADCLTANEKEKLKKRILEELSYHQIQIYTIPDVEDDDQAYLKQINEIKESMPFAISSSTDKIDINGKASYGREYKFGTIDILNSEHSDFLKLRSMLVSHMQDMRELTTELHYENFRSIRLSQSNGGFTNSCNDSGSISSSFYESEKDRILKEKDEELRRMQEMIMKMETEMKMRAKAEPLC